MEKNNQHIDPPRYPKLINPIELMMKMKFEVTLDLIKIDVGKRMTEELKKK